MTCPSVKGLDMRIEFLCMQCFKEQGKPDLTVYPTELQDSGLYLVRCRFGHETVAYTQEMKFEWLFELGAHAIIDGYYREAVASFNSALERFYEFYIKVICAKRGISVSVFDDSWKEVSAQSERQLGAYLFVYLLENNAKPPLLHRKLVEFRNDVIHKGKIPAREEAVVYGQAVLDLIGPILNRLKQQDSEHVRIVVGQHVQNMMKQIRCGPNTMGMTWPTILSIASGEPPSTLREGLDRLTFERKRGTSFRVVDGMVTSVAPEQRPKKADA